MRFQFDLLLGVHIIVPLIAFALVKLPLSPRSFVSFSFSLSMILAPAFASPSVSLSEMLSFRNYLFL